MNNSPNPCYHAESYYFAGILREFLRERAMEKTTSRSHRWPDSFYCNGSVWLDNSQGGAASGGKQRWRAQINYRTPEETWRNKQKTIWAAGVRDAERQFISWHDVEEELHRKRESTDSGASVSEYIARYIAVREEGHQVEPSTIADDKKKSRQVARFLPDMPLDRLRAKDAEAMVARMLGKGLSPQTSRAALGFLKKVVKHACEQGTLDANPIAAVRPPKLQRRKEKRNSLPPAERAKLDRFLAEHPPSRVNIAASLALYTGMRLEEVAALQWEDVDLEADTIFVHQAIGTASGGSYVKDAKTSGSERKVPISGKLHDMLSDWRKATELEWREATQLDDSTEEPPGSLYVVGLFGDGTGDYISTGNLGKMFTGLSDALSLTGTQGKRATFKDLRHTFATTALAEGRDVLSVAAVLGHASAKMTLDVYGEAEERTKRETVEAVANSMSS